MTFRRRQVALAVLGGAGLLAVVFAARDDQPAASPRARAAAPPPVSASESPPVIEVGLDRLETLRTELAEPERNPFRFQARPAPPAPRPAATPRPILEPSPVAPPAGPPPLPPIPLRFIGLVDAPGQAGRVAILSDGRGNVFEGKEGDIIEGRYRVGRIAPDSLELSYADGRGRQVIRLSGQ
ncbi:MAG: hypothetical protein A3I61_12780 [Acidobacteria bacterium RIFCSPLOWO2_02_FULL_68_18]|nr:MAG: hypothetical protein A3I61_12780 [Acidobacteria bacterium RIFCSPLOWO2_02_FULL_68_18]OFW47961.1 MAG: hypothetical protein A3G77_07130 [Acidobacteria bacterium RIFCSPLOWO2_12_FULL_68_19]